MSTPRWLLSLGSNLADDGRVRAALARLPGLGTCHVLTTIRRFPAHHGHGAYFSALVSLAVDADRALLDTRLKALEAELGRQRGRADHAVAIDIDILARDDGHGWQTDAHARGKGEFHEPDVLALLTEAGIAITDA